MESTPTSKASLLNLDIDLKRFLDSFKQSEQELKLHISGAFYIPQDYSQHDWDRLFISIMTYPYLANPLLAQVSFKIPSGLVGKRIMFEHTFGLDREIIPDNKYLSISFATTTIHNSEMGIGASIIEGTFFENYIPIDVSELVEEEKDGE